MTTGEPQVVLTLPAGARFGGAARSVVGELARRRALSSRQWARLEAAVDRTLELFGRHHGDRVTLTFGGGGSGSAQAISVEATLAGPRSGRRAGAPAASTAEVTRLRTDLADLVDAPEVDADGARVRFLSRQH